jgi:glycosyltransferase involved in cell wall biosynthesis
MKIAVNYRVQDGPWGGGNRFVANLVTALEARGDTVTTALDGNNIDIILMVDPRWRNPATTFGPGEILRHLAWRNSDAIAVHRINECDERKGTRGMNDLLKRANYAADHTVFVAEWLRRDLDVWQDMPAGRSSVILNGADPQTFYPHGHVPWDGRSPLRLVTHHWGANWMKGFDIYQRLDAMLAEPRWRDRIAFTYVGNLPEGFRFANATHIPPLDGEALADALRSAHVYVTASINEPGSNHQNEGALCGLPVLFRESGALPEYCTGFGIGFVPDTFEAALKRMLSEYPQWRDRMPGYPHVASRTTERYIALFDDLLARRAEIVGDRNLFRNPIRFARNQLPI